MACSERPWRARRDRSPVWSTPRSWHALERARGEHLELVLKIRERLDVYSRPDLFPAVKHERSRGLGASATTMEPKANRPTHTERTQTTQTKHHNKKRPTKQPTENQTTNNQTNPMEMA